MKRWLDGLLVAGLSSALFAGCFPKDLGVNDLDPAPTCSKKDCGFDAAFIGGNIDVANDLPIAIGVETCSDDVCAEPLEFMLDAGDYASKESVIVSGSGVCPDRPFSCPDARKWWVGWHAPVDVPDGGLVSSFRVIIRTLESGEALEDHEFKAAYESIKPRECKQQSDADGSTKDIRCLQFAAGWD